MIKSVRISNYRGFRSLALEGLTPVTLLVGPNNAGKTSALEAIELILGSRLPRSLFLGPSRRGELVYSDDQPRPDVDVSHLFHGHGVAVGSCFKIEGSNEDRRYVEAEIVRESNPPLENEPRETELPLSQELTKSETLALVVRSERDTTRIPVSEEGVVPFVQARRSVPPSELEKDAPVTFLRAGSDIDIGAQWDRIVLGPEEQNVIDALRIIEPGIERIAALRRSRYASSKMVVKVAGSDLRLPLGSMGDGIRHLLALSICLATSAGGCLLIDEIDTGLHHTVMGKMWKLVVETSLRLNIQVIAATHSGDCLRSLASIFADSPNLRDTISLHRLEKGQERAVRYTVGELAAAAQQNIEVR